MKLSRSQSLALAGILCDLSDWAMSVPRLHKMLYCIDMAHMATFGAPITEEPFQAWSYGPILPSVWFSSNRFGHKLAPVWRGIIFSPSRYSFPDEGLSFIRETLAILNRKTSAELVAITHRRCGAWAHHYQSGCRNVIPKSAELSDWKQLVNESEHES